ncbi:MAG: DNA-packaging protein [Ruminococcaceae bacterium]|nr:DNA-packaging protein [Oscillospiraceae bacterium]
MALIPEDILKAALFLTTDAYNEELRRLQKAGIEDLRRAGIEVGDRHELLGIPPEEGNLVAQAVITYCRMNFGSPKNYDQLKASYDEQKAQMQMMTGYGFPEEKENEDAV